MRPPAPALHVSPAAQSAAVVQSSAPAGQAPVAVAVAHRPIAPPAPPALQQMVPAAHGMAPLAAVQAGAAQVMGAPAAPPAGAWQVCGAVQSAFVAHTSAPAGHAPPAFGIRQAAAPPPPPAQHSMPAAQGFAPPAAVQGGVWQVMTVAPPMPAPPPTAWQVCGAVQSAFVEQTGAPAGHTPAIVGVRHVAPPPPPPPPPVQQI
ncbi:MAG TPA: hypothetical protein VE987_02100 [Polyangiaceae bacterium]|nr:hypothetical protein [Polyangiaceae bacterium]